MAYEFCGLFEKNGDVHRPYWTDPCGGANITSIMELTSGFYRPVKVDVGTCTPDDTYNKIVSGEIQPVLKFNAYASLVELTAGCCELPDTLTIRFYEVDVCATGTCNNTIETAINSASGYELNLDSEDEDYKIFRGTILTGIEIEARFAKATETFDYLVVTGDYEECYGAPMTFFTNTTAGTYELLGQIPNEVPEVCEPGEVVGGGYAEITLT